MMENRSRMNEMHMRRIVSNYELGDLLGKGSYSEVFKARHLEDSRSYAIKVISNRVLTQNAKVKQYISNELAIHNGLEPCPYIVRFHELLQTKNNCYFVYEYCEEGTLLEMIRREGIIEEDKALSIFSQLAEGLKVLHKHKIMHRDLKPENVLIKQGKFKLADFGFCKELGSESMTRTMLGSPLYMAPQVLRGQAYSTNADIWSIGVILYEMLYGHCPFQSHSIASLISTIDDTYLTFDQSVNISAETKKFITKCLQKDFKQRIMWDQLFQQVGKLTQKAQSPFISSNRQIFLKSLPKISHKPQAYTSQEIKQSHKSTSQSKSRYEIFKQNYSKSNELQYPKPVEAAFSKTVDLKNQMQHFNGQNIKSRLTMGRLPEHSTKQKPKQQKYFSFSQMVIYHQACMKLLKCILQKLQGKDCRIYPMLIFYLRGIKRILQKIYNKINLDNSHMIPMLSCVKYELIQIQKVAIQIQKVLPLQASDQIAQQLTVSPELAAQWKILQDIYII